MLSDFLTWYFNLFIDTDNKVKLTVWTATLATFTFTITFVLKPSRKFVLNQIERLKNKLKKEKFPIIRLEANEIGKISPIQDKYFDSKILLAKKLFQTGKKGIKIELVPVYLFKKHDKFQKEKIKLELSDKEKIIEEKIKILLIKNIHYNLDFPENLKMVINTLISPRDSNVSGQIKIDFFRNVEPKIDFAIWITHDELKNIAINYNKSVDNLKNDLRFNIPSLGIFPNEILMNKIIPRLINEIYRRSNNGFAIETSNWENISLYEFGMG